MKSKNEKAVNFVCKLFPGIMNSGGDDVAFLMIVSFHLNHLTNWDCVTDIWMLCLFGGSFLKEVGLCYKIIS